MNILVTGGAGFVGSHLCDKLIAEGHTVHCVDNLYTGSMKNIEQLKGNPRFYFHEIDVTSNEMLLRFMDNSYAFNQIYNLACPASPVHYQKDPLYTFFTNILGARAVLEIAKYHKCRVVQASTSEVYGDPDVHPQPESYWGNVNTIGPRSCYDEGKRGAETIFFDYKRMHGVDIGVFRIFNTYGPRMATNDGRVISNFIVAALADAEITIAGTGIQTRSFCYVSDLVEGIIRFANSKEIGPINLGNPGEFTIEELASIIVRKVGKGYKVYIPRPIDDPQQRKPVITLAYDKLGWKPTIPLEEGLDKTIEYFRSA